MSSTNNNNKSETSSAWGLDTSALDEWLENDLRQSDLFRKKRNSTTDKCSLNHIITKETPLQQQTNDSISIKQEEETVKVEEIEKKQEQQSLQDNNMNKSIPTHLIPLIKVYSLLNTIRQNELLAKDNNHHASIKQMYTSPAPPSPIMSMNSDMAMNDTTNKKKRVNTRSPVDIVTKRQRNTDAARRSRLRKANKMETLEHKVDVLQKDNNRLRVKVAVLENDICHATEKDQRNRLRVLELEAQLALAHRQLVQEYEYEK
ncbi:hypothetical protein BDF21DRAFT_411455 [Thamnidium elegans]|uniref:BZIP domain-containing protein n=1 Tax=Thamnidium elegans TaxID=101142 RepID=A0A8H7SRT3_9FUNG|nr:hypothetical protein INT48_007172 [Thamnidium elegans]KAI8090523.1 hypothetical protein BDF21DRAFT_411455 [Thamnidium elegans]